MAVGWIKDLLNPSDELHTWRRTPRPPCCDFNCWESASRLGFSASSFTRLPRPQLAGHHRFAGLLVLYIDVALHTRGSPSPGKDLDLDPQLVARNYGPAKARLLDSGKHDQLVLAIGNFRQQQ